MQFETRSGKLKIPTPELVLDAARLAVAYDFQEPGSAAIIQDHASYVPGEVHPRSRTRFCSFRIIDKASEKLGQTPSLNMRSCFLARGGDALEAKSSSPRPIDTRLATPLSHYVSHTSYTAISDSLIPCCHADERSSAMYRGVTAPAQARMSRIRCVAVLHLHILKSRQG